MCVIGTAQVGVKQGEWYLNCSTTLFQKLPKTSGATLLARAPAYAGLIFLGLTSLHTLAA